jgi:hypothetical protein
MATASIDGLGLGHLRVREIASVDIVQHCHRKNGMLYWQT